MNEIFSIEGKVAIITGACGALGSSLVNSFAKQGAKVVAIDLKQEQLDDLVAKMQQAGGEVIGVNGDVNNIEALRAIAKDVVAKWGSIDILLNIAGGMIPGATLRPNQSFFEMNTSEWEKVIDLNINSTVYACMAFGEVMAKQERGSIINIASTAASSATTRLPAYSAAKSAVANFTRWLAMELAIKYGDGLRVNAIAPGFFVGEQNREVLVNPDGSLTERSKKIIAKTPMRRFGSIDELNGAVQFLCSDAASFITGALLPVDGGFSAFSGV